MSEAIRLVVYALVSRLFHQPYVLRIIADVMRRLPGLNRVLPTILVARRDAVVELTRRTADFSHAPYWPSLVAGPFVIAEDDDAKVERDREALLDWLPKPAPVAGAGQNHCARGMPGPMEAGHASLASARRSIARLRDAGATSIDLIDDYLMDLVWRELASHFGDEADALLELADRDARLAFLGELRQLGAQLVIGWIAPAAVRERARTCANRVNERVDGALARIAGVAMPQRDLRFRQRLVGLMWVGHPATVQGGALLLQELFERPEILASLGERALRLGDTVWTDIGFRQEIRRHVLELLRFRPIFPFLPRMALRDCSCDVGGGVNVRVKAGGRVVAMTAGAAFDDEANWAPEVYRPGRYRDGTSWARCPEDELLSFGFGARQCVAFHVVIETLTSALTGMLTLPRLRWARRRLFQPRIEYDGVIVAHMQVTFDPLG
jgi:cytochrome P450